MWQQIQIQTSSEETTALEELLLEHGAVSISLIDTEDQPVFQKEPGATPLWKHVTLLALFEANAELNSLLALLSFQPTVLNREALAVEVLEDQAWERSWMSNFEAMQFGEKLWICPSWQTPPDPDAVNIMLDPGLAFGSGTHATTTLCLRWLDSQELTDKEVIDYGSGSGVLAIAAALLGAKRIHAVDNDEQAIAATMDNSNRNQIGNQLITAYLPNELPDLQVDVLLANILAEPLHELADRFAGLVRPGGSLVLSGILEQQSDALLERYGRWFDMATPVLENEWVLLTGKRKS